MALWKVDSGRLWVTYMRSGHSWARAVASHFGNHCSLLRETGHNWWCNTWHAASFCCWVILWLSQSIHGNVFWSSLGIVLHFMSVLGFSSYRIFTILTFLARQSASTSWIIVARYSSHWLLFLFAFLIPPLHWPDTPYRQCPGCFVYCTVVNFVVFCLLSVQLAPAMRIIFCGTWFGGSTVSVFGPYPYHRITCFVCLLLLICLTMT